MFPRVPHPFIIMLTLFHIILLFYHYLLCTVFVLSVGNFMKRAVMAPDLRQWRGERRSRRRSLAGRHMTRLTLRPKGQRSRRLNSKSRRKKAKNNLTSPLLILSGFFPAFEEACDLKQMKDALCDDL